MSVGSSSNLHSHSVSTSYPAARAASSSRASRSLFRANIASQKPVRDFGIRNVAHPSWACQKQPWTGAIFRRRGTDIWFARYSLQLDTEQVPDRVQPADCQLGFGFRPPNTGHHYTSLLGREWIDYQIDMGADTKEHTVSKRSATIPSKAVSCVRQKELIHR